ncbi:hypothetical protein BC6307_07345 [Sutcliffiella cohnii]|uniref:Uncharacterized protein n=1 Tax=Sutcliffiella cohnii TaxID=33932 RepID=A0A223KXW8_9BACI|nr:hypothetical protein BC6307_07345 [Sutcliffiella cohnii]
MEINTDSLVTFIIMWGIPIFMVFRGYFKLDTDDKKSAMKDFRSKRFILTIGFIVGGVFLTHLGVLFAINILKGIGIAILIIGGIFSTIEMWKESKIKSVPILILVSFVVLINVT